MRALVVSYAFPPVGGAGVQRVLKLVKYLPAHGVTPVVLTVHNPSVPVRDASLGRDVPAGVDVVRAPTLEPGYATKMLAWRSREAPERGFAARVRSRLVELGRHALLPDPQVLWLPGAARALVGRLTSTEPDDVVFISGPPFSQFLLGALARTRRGAAVVLDYRDEWTTTRTIYEMAGGAAERVGATLERAILPCAHAVTTATEAFRKELLRRFAFLDPERVHVIPNGYDPDDFPDVLPSPPADRFVLTYAGTVFRLTSARGLVEAVRRVHAREPELAARLEVRVVGRIAETEASTFEGTEALGVRRLGYLDHARAVEELASCHASVCILDDVAGAERIHPAKIFEIMRLRRPCLVLAPEGALADLVRRHCAGEVVPPRDPEAIAAALARMLRAFAAGATAPSSSPIDIERFDRRRQAGQFAAVFADAAEAARKRPAQPLPVPSPGGSPRPPR